MIHARIISVENPTALPGINPHCTDYRHSKFVRRRQYVETVLLPQIAGLMPVSIFPAVTDEHFTAEAGTVQYGGLTLRVRAGNTGNFLSHLRLWRGCVETVLILEDDAELPPENAQNVLEAIDRFAAYSGPAVLHLLSAMPHQEHGTKDFADYEHAGGLLRLRSAGDLSGTAAYAVNPAGAAELFVAAMRDGTLPTDGFIHRAFERGEIAVMVPAEYHRCFMLHQHFEPWNHDHTPER